jgi:Flp pilus assembly protein TadG
MMRRRAIIEGRSVAKSRGTAAIEFGLAIPFLLILVVATVEIGFATYEGMQVYNSVEAGALYAAKNGFDATGISSAVVNATGLSGITASPAPVQFCGCPSVTGVATATCGGTCSGGGTAGTYVRISAAYTHTTILSYPTFGLPATLTAQSVVRIN